MQCAVETLLVVLQKEFIFHLKEVDEVICASELLTTYSQTHTTVHLKTGVIFFLLFHPGPDIGFK